jgi:hypothetical protein
MFRKATLLAAVLTTSAAVAACGGSTPTKTAKTAHKNTALKLAECMRTHGVPDFPDPQSGGGYGIQASAGSSGGSVVVNGHTINESAPAFQTAMNSCQKDQPQGPATSGSQLTAARQGALKMAECMRSSGVPNFPDPKVSAGPGGHGIQVEIGVGGSGPGSGPSKAAAQASPAFQKAMNKCQKYMRVGPKRTAG